MAATTGRQLITGVPRTPNPYGLFTAVTPREPADPHWQWHGVEWEALPCRNPNAYGPLNCDPDTPPKGSPKNLNNAGPVLNQADPFNVNFPFVCAPVGYTQDQMQDAATQALLAGEQAEVEWLLWSGHLGTEPSLPDSAEPAADAPLDPVAALAALESWYHGHTGTVNGQLGYIHMGVSAATILNSRGALIYSGNQITTAVGSRVIIGTGYGSAALQDDGSITDRMYITPPPFIYRSEIYYPSNTPGDGLDQGHNKMTTLAERTYLVGWDSCPESYYVDLQWPDEDQRIPLPDTYPFEITSPADGTEFAVNDSITVSGTGTPGRDVQLHGEGTEASTSDSTTTVKDDGTWSDSAGFAKAQDVTFTATEGLRQREVTVTVT